MAIATKSIADVAKKWADVTPGRSSYYQAAASVAGDTWVKATTDATQNYKNAVTAGNIGQLFSGGVKKAGADKYNRKVTDVGASRFGPGVTAAVTDYQSGMDPMLTTIQGVTLQARQPRGNTANLQRVAQIADALHKKRLALRAAGA